MEKQYLILFYSFVYTYDLLRITVLDINALKYYATGGRFVLYCDPRTNLLLKYKRHQVALIQQKLL